MSFGFLRSLFLLFLVALLCNSCAILGGGESKIKRADDYNLSVPSNWKQLSSKGDSDRAYQTSTNNSVSVTSHCDRNNEASLTVLTRQILIGTRNVKILEQNEILINGGRGLYSSVEAVSDGTKFFLGIGVVKKLGCVFDFSLVSPKPLNQEQKKEFLTFIKSIEYGTH